MYFAHFPTSFLSLLLAWSLIPLATVRAYFIVNSPSSGMIWANGAANPVQWTKGLEDGIDSFDIELTRLSQQGLTFVAQGVPATLSSVNVFLQDLPTGDDYYLLFLNSTHGLMYATSQKFSIIASANSSTPAAITSAPTVTVSGSPNPLQAFATTFPPSANGVASPAWHALDGAFPQAVAVLATMTLGLLGGAWAVL
ncbi:hypothetical protein CERSUDRAFT_85741 [Gelatoporia subvermispora B]|uniref:Ser-Thr-rich glycosyl-phosphatidyl-inositol-anchored membrane family-domain-containing protein n=1 Tax=Ceriporiopsis subvermispora (strain B) TaxID=914234 RepID=M2R8H4_CERS8|nr:hypothetical protein CERSUDRAFT_85741 [Gelatoporia subvermispora B]